MKLQAVKGTRDFYPDQMRRRNWLFERFRATARTFNFQEYDACILEHEDLYTRKAGDEISEQLYCFPDKSGRRLALRPELTPSLARMVIERERSLQFPLKWFSIVQCFRYERMQKGRRREHYQWNMDIVGDNQLTAEAELMAAIADLCRTVGLSESDFQIRFSNRLILQDVLDRCGVPRQRFEEVCVILDKRDKLGNEAVAGLLAQAHIASEAIDTILEVLKARTPEEMSSAYTDKLNGIQDIIDLMELCGTYGIARSVSFDVGIVRGLSYYTGTVFEVYEVAGSSRAICGGGRYDRLIETFGGSPTPMVGFGFGDVVISDILEERSLFPPSAEEGKVVVVAYSSDQRDEAIRLGGSLRADGMQVELDLSYRKLSKSFSRAGKLGFTTVVLAAPQELARGMVTVRNLVRQTERVVAVEGFCRGSLDW